jgi:hypothetical protein
MKFYTLFFIGLLLNLNASKFQNLLNKTKTAVDTVGGSKFLSKVADVVYQHKYNHACERHIDEFDDYAACIGHFFFKDPNAPVNKKLNIQKYLNYFNTLDESKQEKIYEYFIRDCGRLKVACNVLPGLFFKERGQVKCVC